MEDEGTFRNDLVSGLSSLVARGIVYGEGENGRRAALVGVEGKEGDIKDSVWEMWSPIDIQVEMSGSQMEYVFRREVLDGDIKKGIIISSLLGREQRGRPMTEQPAMFAQKRKTIKAHGPFCKIDLV